MSLKLRITLITAVLIAITSSTIGAASYLSISRAQLSAIDSTLRNTIGSNPLRMAERQLRRENMPPDFYTPVAVALVDSSGNISVIRSAGTDTEPEEFPTLPEEEIKAVRDQTLTFTDDSLDETYRLVARSAGPRFNVVALTSLAEFTRTMQQILLSIIFFVLGVTILGALASWLIVRKSFSPVDSMIAAAAAIAGGDNSQRVPDAPKGTELGDLSHSLNVMINSLTASITRVENSEKSLRKFISDASHEIRTPLTVIRGYVEILLADGPPSSDRDARALDRIDSESKRLERLVTSLLDLESQQRKPVSFREIRLDELVSVHFSDLVAISPRPIVTDLDPVVIEGDPDSWGQLLSNVTQNIIRYTPPESAVGVSVRKINLHETIYAEVIINDCGPGIPSEHRDDVFLRFSRLDPSRSTETGGFGLGMSIIKAVVKSHSGQIELGTSDCGGLRIKILVPGLNL